MTSGIIWACTWLNATMKAVIPKRMKTAVSLPDPLFKAADQLARQLGKSRSQLYAEALREYLERHRDEDITRRLNEIYDAEPEFAKLDPVFGHAIHVAPQKKNGSFKRGECGGRTLPGSGRVRPGLPSPRS